MPRRKAESDTAPPTGLVIEYRPIDALVPYANNARTHPPEQIKAIAASLAEFGWATPIGIAKGILVYGHARLAAATALRDAGVAIPNHPDPATVPTVDLSHLSDAQRKAYVIADNKLALAAGWDLSVLKIEMGGLLDEGFDLDLLGFAPFELEALMSPKGPEEDPDWKGMPEYEQDDNGPFRSITIHFTDQEGVNDFARMMGQNVTDKTKWLWHPQKETQTPADTEYASEA